MEDGRLMAQEIVWHATDLTLARDTGTGDVTVMGPPETLARMAREATDRAILDATAQLMADAHTDGQPWVQPTAAHDAYPLGITVTHGGKTWENLTPANVWQPGVSGWRELVAQGYPTWVQPTGAHDVYGAGDRVRFEGADYESTINGNSWSPTAYPAGWRKL